MAKIVAIEHVTLDGVMQAPARPDEDRRDGFESGGWAAAAGGDPALQKIVGARMGNAWSLLVGRVTYEDFFKVWPNRTGPMSDALNNVGKFVVSTTLKEPLPWQNSTLLSGIDAVAELKKTHDKTLVIFGSGVLVQSLMRRDLVDEIVLQIHPRVLGKGRRLFADSAAEFRLIESASTGSGVIVATLATER